MVQNEEQRGLRLSIVALLIMSAVFALLQFGFTDWAVWQQFSMVRDELPNYFCEYARMDEIFRERMNTWSNLAFFFSGAWMAVIGFFDSKKNAPAGNLIQHYPVYSYLFSFVLIYLFLGSALFHASLTPFPQQWDMSGVFALVAAPLVYNGHRVYNYLRFGKICVRTDLATNLSIGAFVVIFIGLTALKWQLDEFLVVPVFIIINGAMIAYLEMKTMIRTKFLWWSIACIIVAMVAFFLDLEKIGCLPKSPLQFHSLWHIGSAVGALLLYFYFRSESM